nr:MAG: hypothetical protein DIU56_17225 [Pseudomonadota bacterium]
MEALTAQIETTRYAVRAINTDGLEGADYVTVYGACPEKFTDRAEAEAWAYRLSRSGNWPRGNPGYEVIELDE